jgi:hypothetical protein
MVLCSPIHATYPTHLILLNFIILIILGEECIASAIFRVNVMGGEDIV